jgi:Golgi nucleoside diphosphatase
MLLKSLEREGFDVQEQVHVPFCSKNKGERRKRNAFTSLAFEVGENYFILHIYIYIYMYVYIKSLNIYS